MWEQFLDISAWVLPVLTAIILHEMAHGWAAEKLGDPTARLMGRISLNPLRHIDPFGTLLLPAALIAINAPVVFGAAKAVPVNFGLLRPPRLGMALVALAGPAANMLLALLSALLLHLDKLVTPEHAPWLFLNLYRALMLNCVLICFNLLPMMPLDGGRVVASLLRGRAQRLWLGLERWGIAILLVLLLVPPYFSIDVLQAVLLAPIFWLIEGFLFVTGNSG